nr:MAG TPA: hypothetical protein [Caudoviricetes sp.]
MCFFLTYLNLCGTMIGVVDLCYACNGVGEML